MYTPYRKTGQVTAHSALVAGYNRIFFLSWPLLFLYGLSASTFQLSYSVLAQAIYCFLPCHRLPSLCSSKIGPSHTFRPPVNEGETSRFVSNWCHNQPVWNSRLLSTGVEFIKCFPQLVVQLKQIGFKGFDNVPDLRWKSPPGIFSGGSGKKHFSFDLLFFIETLSSFSPYKLCFWCSLVRGYRTNRYGKLIWHMSLNVFRGSAKP